MKNHTLLWVPKQLSPGSHLGPCPAVWGVDERGREGGWGEPGGVCRRWWAPRTKPEWRRGPEGVLQGASHLRGPGKPRARGSRYRWDLNGR